ncbi:uncharacterized protein FOMMEDRAFT_145788 [Fomitiporia mediterranea MF3/22]|uniref:uncharacterized protein n=1 Tax=Fomitiporia mediterranea (strain MF3/22) TaxID=694068 RepID=UPI000440799A|nr:uncharacterized protein FOMMEDRAFT_145788 [Fomitiporia mediterranea MF3/22]EJD05272.1 hypothetical protein FOMMEDRAFT_145788 [Fomitiporia mediterranea MF3/22]
MATTAEQIALLPQIVSDTRTTNYLTLAAFVIFLYDMVLTFPRELELVWKARWTTGKVLFILNRLAFESAAYGFADMFDYFSPFNIISFALFQIMWKPVILILRTLALWEQNRKILVFLLAALLATDGTIIASIALITKSLSFQDRPVTKQILGCYGALNDISISQAIPSWAALIAFDTIVFALTVVRVEGIRRAKKDQSRLLHILFRDGIMFYLIMLAASVANLALYAGLPFRRRGLIISLIPLLRTVMSVCTARLLLNLREAAVETGNGRIGEGWNWALGELEGDCGTSTGKVESTLTFSRTGASVELARCSFFDPQSSQSADSPAPLPVEVQEPEFELELLPPPPPLSERGRIIVSVSTEAEVYTDDGHSLEPSSLRAAVLDRFTSLANGDIELGELRGRSPDITR